MPNTDTPPQQTSLVSLPAAAKATGLDVFSILQLAESGAIPSEVRRVVDLDALRLHLAQTQEPA